MKLSEKLARIESQDAAHRPAALTEERRRPERRRGADPVGAARRKARAKILEEVAPTLGARKRSSSELVEAVGGAVAREAAGLDATARDAFVAGLTSDLLGYGPLDPFLGDGSVNEIMCNAPDEIWVERAGMLELTGAMFTDDDHYRAVIDRIVGGIGRRLDESSPMVDARLPDGSRVNVVIPPLTPGSPVMTIRKFRADPYQMADLMNAGTLSLEAAVFLETCVRGKQNVVISGGTGSGKTTTLNVLSGFVPEGERIITIEDVMELRLSQPHVVALEHRPPNTEGRGEVSIRDLVRNALRMRPDRIVVGEVRGPEALDMLQAMNTGHEGSLTTLHANSPRDALSRLETMVLMAGFDLPMRAIRDQVASALDVVVHQERDRDGRRHITEISEVQGMEGDVVTLSKVFVWDHNRRSLVHTGLRPRLLETLADRGVEIPPPWTAAPAPSRSNGKKAAARRSARSSK